VSRPRKKAPHFTHGVLPCQITALRTNSGSSQTPNNATTIQIQ
jgi:hypothetical protein